MTEKFNKDQIRYHNNPFNRKTRGEDDNDYDDSLQNRTFDVSISSDKPCDRGYFIEILDHSKGSIDMELIGRDEGIPVLWAHDKIGESENPGSNVLGRLTNPYLEGNQLRGKMVLSEVEDHVVMKVREKIITDLSVGYRVLEHKENDEGDKPIVTVTKWQPHEVSLCALGLDASVGVNRSLNNIKETSTNSRMPGYDKKEYDESTEDKEKLKKKEQKMPDNEKDQKMSEKKFDVTELETRVAKEKSDERKRIDMVYRVADQFGLSNEERSYFIDNNSSAEVMMEKILERKSQTKQEPMNMGPSDIPEDAKREYSLGGVINALCGKRSAYDAGVVLEVSRELERKYNRPLADEQIHVPWSALVGQRTYTVAEANPGNGGQLISSPTLTDQLIEALRPLSVLPTLGLNVQSGLTDNFKIPRQTTVSTPTNLATDTSPITETQGEYDFIEFSPKGIGALSKISKQLSYQVPQAESFIRNDLMREIGLRLDQQFFYGSGARGQAQGLIPGTTPAPFTGVNTTAPSADGDDLTPEMLIIGESAIDNQNVMGQPMAVVNSKVWGTLKSLREGRAQDNKGAYLWTNSRDNSTTFGVSEFRGIPIVKSNIVIGNRTQGGSANNTSDLIMGVFNYAYWANFGPGLVMERGFDGNDFSINVQSIKMTTYIDFQYKHPQAFYIRRGIKTSV